MCVCVSAHSGCDWPLATVSNNDVITSPAATVTVRTVMDIVIAINTGKERILVNYFITNKFTKSF